MVVILNDRAFEPALPDMPATAAKLVVALCVRDQQSLDEATDRVLERLDQQVDVVRHQAVAIQLERLPLTQVRCGLEESLKIRAVEEDLLPVVPTIHDVVNQPWSNRSQWTRHRSRIADAA